MTDMCMQPVELSMDDMDKAGGGFWGWVIAAVIIVVGVSLEGESAFSESGRPDGDLLSETSNNT